MKKIGVSILIIVGLVFLVYVGVSLYVAIELTKPIPSPVTENPRIISESYEDVSFTSSDNFNLKGWLFKNKPGNKLVIFVNGTNQNRTGQDYGAMQVAKELYDAGYSILLFDRRTTGQSDGNRITFGGPERLDVVGAVGFAQSKGYDPKNIGIIAYSLGAISTIMGANQLESVGAIVLDSPAAQIKPIIENILQNEKNIPAFLNFGIFTAAKILYGIDLDSIQPINELKKVPARVFLYLHGDSDTVIPKINSEELLTASNPQSRLVIFNGAKHVQTYKTNPELYRREVFDFLNSNLGTPKD